jgi:hypothetical protein
MRTFNKPTVKLIPFPQSSLLVGLVVAIVLSYGACFPDEELGRGQIPP